MTNRMNSVGFCALALVGAFALGGTGDQPPAAGKETVDQSGEEVIAFAKAPDAVRAAALAVIPGGEKAITKVTRESDDEIVIYEVEFSEAGAACSAVMSAAGVMLEVEKAVQEATLPAAALAALKKEYPNATFKDHVVIQKTYYELEVVVNGKSHEVSVNAAGDIEDDEGEVEGDGDEGDEGGKDDDKD